MSITESFSQLDPAIAIRETQAHNLAVLTNGVPAAVRNDGSIGVDIDGERCRTKYVQLYVDRVTGLIAGAGSREEISRMEARLPKDTPHAEVEARATGLSRRLLNNPDIVRIPAEFRIALPTRTDPETGFYTIKRPSSWVRNTQIVLAEVMDDETPLDETIPDPIEFGMFLKSVESYNQTPEPDTIFDQYRADSLEARQSARLARRPRTARLIASMVAIAAVASPFVVRDGHSAQPPAPQHHDAGKNAQATQVERRP